MTTPRGPVRGEPAARGPVAATGAGLAAALGVVGRARRAKALHPAGAVLAGTLERHGRARSGIAWLDARGEDGVVVRLSRGGGLPPALPDVLGLAIRWVGDDDALPVDLLLSTTGSAPFLRHVLRPWRTGGSGPFTTLVPFRAPRGPVLLAAVPEPPRALPAAPEALAAVLARSPMTLNLAYAAPLGPWRSFGRLVVRGAVGPGVDLPVRFDPLRTPPGLDTYPWVAALREPAYREARRAWPGRRSGA